MTTLRSLEALLVAKLRANKHRLRKVAVVQQAAGILPRGRPGKNIALRPHVNEANCISLLLGYYAADEVQCAAEEASAFFDLAPNAARVRDIYPDGELVTLERAERVDFIWRHFWPSPAQADEMR